MIFFRKKTLSLIIMTALTLSQNVFSSEIIELNKNHYPFKNKEKDIITIKESISSILRESNINNNEEIKIKPVDDSGIYFYENQEAGTNKNEGYYITSDGKNIIKGTLFKIDNGKIKYKYGNISSEKNRQLLYSLDQTKLITYKPKFVKNRIFVLMDYTCPFSKKFHNETLNKLLQNDIEVTYIPYQRDPSNRKTKNGLAEIFCFNKSDDYKKELLNKAFSQEKTFISENCNTDQNIGINILDITNGFDAYGTPTILNVAGDNLGGFQTVNEVLGKIK